MSVDERLRSGLAANTKHLRPNLEHEFAVVQRRVHRRRRIRWAGYGLAAIGTAAAAVVWLPSAIDAIGSMDGSTDPAVRHTEPTPAPSAIPLAPPQGIAPGTYAMQFVGSGETAQSSAVIEITSDAFRYDGTILISGGDASYRAVSLWTVAEVAANPCHGATREWVDPGPTVEDLAAALAAQPLKSGTDPVPVSLAGYDGLYVETAVAVGDDNDCVDQSFASWRAADGTLRVHEGGGEVGRLWILDVEGRRLVVDASHAAGTSTDRIAELTAMVESITFAATTDQPK